MKKGRGNTADRLARPRIQAIAAAVQAGDQDRVNALVLESIAEHIARYAAERVVAQMSSAEIASAE